MVDQPIVVRSLSKTYRVPEREPGLWASIQGLFRRTYRDVQAVREIDFAVEPGQMVGLIGPNGAGKTTTLKMLSGLLRPSEGEARVLGFVPWKREPAYLRRISMVLGNKSQMLWDIPPLDTFHVLGEIYEVDRSELTRRVDELVELLDMQDLLRKPVRTLSLGERMKCELVAGLLHRPEVLFLDEPTLGLDVSMQGRLRRFLAEYNRQNGVTVILTSHYMADVVALCSRVILIHHGRLLYDGGLDGLATRLAPFKLIRVSLRVEDGDAGRSDSDALDLGVGLLATVPEGLLEAVGVVEQAGDRFTLRVERPAAPQVTAHLLSTMPVADLSVEDPPIEAVIDQVYQEGRA
jgi:ABC-2 type transport system ATP-binding protein